MCNLWPSVRRALHVLNCAQSVNEGWDSVIGIATVSWTVRRLNPVRGVIFRTPSIPPIEPTQPPVQWVPGVFPGAKAAGVWL